MVEKPNPDKIKSLSDMVKNVWGRRQDGLDLPDDFITNLPVTHEQLLHLLTLYPFLQIVSDEAENFYEDGPKFLESAHDWVIHDYGDAVSTSLGLSLYLGNEYHTLQDIFNKPDAQEEDEEEGGEEGEGDRELNPWSGTVVKQSYDTAYEMVMMGRDKGWKGLTIISGTDLMKWSSWMAAQDFNMEVYNFEPTNEDIAKRERIKEVAAQAGKWHAPEYTV